MSASEAPASGPRVLRQDLRLYPGPRVGGAPRWMLYDCVRHAYFQLDANAFAVLSAWDGPADAVALAARLEQDGPLLPAGTVEAFFDFAERNELLEGGHGAWQGYTRRKSAGRSSPLMWLVHNYLFIKIPLWRPRRAFERAGFLAAPLYTRGFAIGTALAALVALYLVSRQWSAFTGTFAGFLSLDGALVYAMALVGTKTVHEFAHAFTAARYGCRASSMGIAFMVVVPMLYCDVTDSWRLPDRRQRMAIDAAGIIAEAVLAIYATLAWVLLPEGSLRTGAFLIATASMISSLLINLNPMMRFDGYLLMADALAVPNLQARAFALLRWRIREALFDLRASKPDQFAPAKQRVVIGYAAAIVCYRATVYAGIALLVYHATFKLLGIALFAVEVGWFLVAPVWKETAMWWRLKHGISATRRSRITAGVVLATLFLLVFPFHTNVVVPAVLEPAVYARIFPTVPAMVQSVGVRRGDAVTAGTTLVTLVSPQNERDRALARIKLALVEAKLQRRASVAEDRAETLSLATERKLLLERLDGLERERRELVLTSPIAGVVRDLDPDLDPGRWVGRDAQIALITAPDTAVVRGYVRDGAAQGVASGSDGTFVPDSFFYAEAPVHVADIGYAAAPRLDISTLSSLDGGPIAARPTKDRGAAPDFAVFPIRFSAEVGAPRTVTRGAVRVAGARESVVGAMLRQVARVLVRESGF